MPGGDGITATIAILATCPSTRVLVLTMFDLDEYVIGALRAGPADSSSRPRLRPTSSPQ
jgi:DNA-binding NarL/FixJ family response regulator